MIGQRLLCIANGDLDNLSWAKKVARGFDKIVAIDGGLHYCHLLGLSPDLIVGDLDSLSPLQLESYKEVPLIAVPWEKDQTDLELALQRLDPASCQEVVLLAALGRRTDHLLGNLNLLTRYRGKVRAISPTETLWVVEKREEIEVAIGQELSLIPMNGPVTGITTRGLKWELHNATLDKFFLGISNICLEKRVVIEVGDGDLLVALQQSRRLVPQF